MPTSNFAVTELLFSCLAIIAITTVTSCLQRNEMDTKQTFFFRLQPHQSAKLQVPPKLRGTSIL